MARPCLSAALLAACCSLPSFASAQQACSDYGAELATMVSADQALRKRVDFLDQGSSAQAKLAGQIALVDRTNMERLKALIARCGWPTKAAHGEQAPEDAWLLAQHADRDLAFQKQVLVLIEEAAAASGEGINKSFAYLYDRVAAAEQRPQRYGTQLFSPSGKACDLAFKPLDDRQKVEERRAQLGLPSLEGYLRIVKELQHCNGDPHYPQPIADDEVKRK